MSMRPDDATVLLGRAGRWALPLFLVVGIVQLSEGSYHSDLATHADEAAHFVTAMCVLDYVRTGLGTDPIAFAESYYVRYPKVAFGHWPPAFYGIQAIWYAIVGATPATGLLLIGLIAASTALVLFLRLQDLYGTWTACLSIAVFFSLPVVRTSSSILMPDMLAGFFVMLALFAFCDASGFRLSSRRFALWTAMAILTKASALALLPFGVVGQMWLGRETTRESTPKRRPWIGYSLVVAAPIVALGLSHATGLRPFPSLGELPALSERVPFLMRFARIAPWAVFVVAALGALRTLAGDSFDRRRTTHVRGALLLIAIWLLAQVAVRDTIADRYFLPAVFPLMLLFAAGFDWLSQHLVAWLDARLNGRRSMPHAAVRVLTAIITVASVSAVFTATTNRRAEYAATAALPSMAAGGPVILVSSDPRGEGALIAEFLVRDTARQRIILRASKMLASSDWMGGEYRMLASSMADVRAVLDAIPVQFIVLDAHGFADSSSRPHHRLLERTLIEGADQFRLVNEVPLLQGHGQGDRQEDRQAGVMIRVYENLNARGRRPTVVRVPMVSSLGRTLELRVDDREWVPPESARQEESPSVARIAGVADRLRAMLPGRRRRPAPLRVRGAHDALDAEGGPGQIFVRADADREWSARATVPWISIRSGSGGDGEGIIRYEVSPNDSGHPRAGSIEIDDTQYAVTQEARP